MATVSADTSPLIEALRWFDDDSRPKRASRIEWASSLYQSPGMVAGELVQLNLMEEARVCYINGQFLAAMLCATSAVEHLLVAEVEERICQSAKLTFGPLIEKADAMGLLPPEVIERLKVLNERRNPVAHRRPPEDKSTLTSRYLEKKVHPNVLLEADAKHSLEVMYEVFLLLLKRCA
jgi:hypothetical protein